MPEQWVSVVEAAATLKVHTRTIERHIKSGKIESRRAEDGQLQVLIDMPEQPSMAPDALSVVAGQAENQVQLALGTTSAIVRTAQEDARLARRDAERAWDETHSARRGARVAWIGVALMAAGIVGAVGWSSARMTRATVELEHATGQLQKLSDEVGQASDEKDHLRTELNLEHERRARAEGELAGRMAAIVGQRPPATRPANLLDRLANVLSGTPSDVPGRE